MQLKRNTALFRISFELLQKYTRENELFKEVIYILIFLDKENDFENMYLLGLTQAFLVTKSKSFISTTLHTQL